MMKKRRRSDQEEEEAEEEEEDPLDGDCEDDDIICDNYLPTPLTNSGRLGFVVSGMHMHTLH